jgi:hypothetical protein
MYQTQGLKPRDTRYYEAAARLCAQGSDTHYPGEELRAQSYGDLRPGYLQDDQPGDTPHPEASRQVPIASPTPHRCIRHATSLIVSSARNSLTILRTPAPRLTSFIARRPASPLSAPQPACQLRHRQIRAPVAYAIDRAYQCHWRSRQIAFGVAGVADGILVAMATGTR